METQEIEKKKTKSVIPEFKKLSSTFESHKGEKDPHKIEYYTKELQRRLRPLKDSTDNNTELKQILEWERRVGVISRADKYKLNKLEWESITKTEDSGEAICKNKVPNSAFGCSIGTMIKFKSYWDEGRNDKMYTLFIPYIVEPEAQVSKELAFKMAHGFMPNPTDYEEPRTDYKRFDLRGREFDKYFDIVE